MRNSFFSFKQFTVQQQNCAMKVCTDACLFGAIVAKHFETTAVNNILDIGTGTGLLSLMLAQKINAVIDAVEIDEHAAMQAAYNFQQSPWEERLHLHNTTIQHFKSLHKYDLIICNPPFYENDLKSDNEKRNIALHSSNLSFEELISTAKKHISKSGTFVVMLPYHRVFNFEKLTSTNNFFINKRFLIKQTPQHNFFRTVLFFSFKENKRMQEEIIIQNMDKKYSTEFSELLYDYYLNLSWSGKKLL